MAENRLCVPWLLAGLLVLSALLHFAWFTYPMTVVLDEVHYGRFAMAAMRHEFFFDIHPPLGKLLYWATGVLAGLDPSFTFPGNQVPLPDASYLALRVLPRLVGTFFPLLMFGVARELGMSVHAALMVALLVVFENATELISQFVFIDIFLLAFGFTAVWAYLRYKNTARIQWLFLAGIAAGCAIATKWTGLSFCVLVGCMELIRFIRHRSWLGLWALLVLGILPFIIYVATFAAQFALLTQYSAAAQTFSPGFRATLAGSPEHISNIGSTAVLILAGFLIVFIHAAVTILVSRLIRAPMFLAVVSSQANIGGVASAPIVAAIYQPGLASVGLLLAILGNIIGTYLGIVTGQLCHWVAR